MICISNEVGVDGLRLNMTILEFAVPFEVLVGGVINQLTPTAEDGDLKLINIAQVDLWDAEIVVQTILP